MDMIVQPDVNEEAVHTVFKLFTEAAIIEHLTRNRLQDFVEPGMTAGQFGLINHFIRLGVAEESEAALAWAFQDDDAYMAEKIDGLIAKGYAQTRPSPDGGRLVSITPAGEAARTQSITRMVPEISPLIEGLDPEALETTLATLRELRRTLDNLPDR